MTQITKRALPEQALLARHCAAGDYVDCLTTDISKTADLAGFVVALYSSGAFWAERRALGLFLNKGASDEDIAALAAGTATSFAAWNVEGRSDRQLLMRDFMGRTRSWLMVEALNAGGTRLYFGTSVNDAARGGFMAVVERGTFRILLPVHKFYARALLRSAARGLGG